MLFYLNNCILSNLDEKKLLALETLAIWKYKGLIKLTGDLECLESLSVLEGLGNTAKQVYNICVAKWSIACGYIQYLDRYIHLTDKANLHHNSAEILYPLTEVNNIEQGLVYFIPEDVGDIDFYRKIAEYYAQENFSNTEDLIKFSKVQGGGDRTRYIFQDYANNPNVLTLCILDSDKYCPNSPISDKAQQAQIINLRTSAKSALIVLPVHEKENLIPLKALEKAFIGHSKHSQLIRVFSNDEYQSIQAYVDMKKGVKSCQVMKYSNRLDYEKLSEHLQLPKPANCIDPDQRNCNCPKIVPPFSKRLMDESIKNIDFDMIKLEHMNFQRTWNDLGRAIYSWLCADEPIRV